MACLFLAGKVEESLRKVEAVVNYCLRLEDRRAGREPDVHPSSEPFKKLVAQVLYLEEVILVALQFDLTVFHPHPLVSRAVKRYTDSGALSISQANALGRCAWQILSDMYTTPLCTLHSQEILAATALLLAYHTIIDLPPFSPQQYKDSLAGLSTEEGKAISWSDKAMLEEIDAAVSFTVDWWRKAKNHLFQDNSKRLSTTMPKAVDLSESTVQTVAGTPRLAALPSPNEHVTKATQDEVFQGTVDAMQLDSPVIPPFASPDKDYEGPPTPG